jgi:Helix-turn-helix domain
MPDDSIQGALQILDQVIASAAPEVVPAMIAALSARVTAATARLLASGEGQNGQAKPQSEPDRLLSPEEAAALMGVSPRWLRRRAKALPFARRLSRKALRFSEVGLRRFLAARRP